MDDSVYSLIDTAIKIGLGAVIAGLASYFISKQNHKNMIDIGGLEDKRNLVKELAVKLEYVESNVNEVIIRLYHRDVSEAQKSLVVATREAYTARAISNLVGCSELVGKLHDVAEIVEKMYFMLDDVNPNNDGIASLCQSLSEAKSQAYPFIKKIYLAP